MKILILLKIIIFIDLRSLRAIPAFSARSFQAILKLRELSPPSHIPMYQLNNEP